MINKFISGLKPNERKILAAVSVAAILGLFYILLLKPALDRSAQIDMMIQKEQSEVLKNTQFLAGRDKAVQEAGKFKDFFTKDVKSEEEVIGDLLKKIELLATQSGVQMSKISPSGQDVQDDYLKYFVSVDCSGSLQSLTNFVYSINNLKELFKVEKMNIGNNAKSAETVQASLTVSRMIIGADSAVAARGLVSVKEDKEAAKPVAAPQE